MPKLARRTDRRGAWSLAPLVGVQAEAAKVREAGLPRTAAGLQKAVVVTLKAVLAARGLDTSGQKAQLVARLLSVLQGE